MFRTPISITDLYIGSTLISIILLIGTLISNTHPVVVFLALVTPSFIITLRLVLLSEEYSEQNLVKIQSDVYLSSIALGILSVLLIGIVTYSISSTLWAVLIFGCSIAPLRILHTTIGKTYDTIEFGFRSSLPESELWESGNVCIQNGRDATKPVLKFLWYWLAGQRFKTLTNRTSPDELYDNHHIATGYYAITTSLAEKFSPFTATQHNNISEVELDSILVDFTQQECYRCGTHHPVSKMYILTDDGTVTEMYCEDCVEQHDPSASTTSRSDFDRSKQAEESTDESTDQTQQETQEQQDSRKRRQHASWHREQQRQEESTERTEQPTDAELKASLDTLGLTKQEFETLSESELKQRYRELVQETHPDAGGDADQFKRIVEAYQDLQKRLES